MPLDKSFLYKFIKVTEKAAIGAYNFLGKDNKIAADKAAVDPMRLELNRIEMNGKIVIGEGEMDEAPMLYIGEELGTKNGPFLDIAVDPLEGTNFVAKNKPGAFSMLAVTKKGNLFSAPDTYMEKIAIGPGYTKNLLDLDNTIEQNIELLSKEKGVKSNELTACILLRPRHDKIVKSLKRMGVSINFITDGDVAGALLTAEKNSKVDIYIGIGGGPEGVLAAAALSCYGGQIQTRLVLNDNEKIKAKNMGIIDVNKKYNIDDMIKDDVMFCATAITDSDILNGIKKEDNFLVTHSIALHKDLNISEKILNKYKYEL